MINLKTITTFIISILCGLFFVFLLPLISIKPIILFALPLVALFSILLINKPELVLAILLILRPLLDNILNLTKVGAGSISFGIGAILNLLVIFLVVYLLFRDSGLRNKSQLIKPWLIYLFIIFISCLYSPYTGLAIKLFASYLSLFAMYLLPAILIKNKNDFNYWFKVYIYSFFLPILFANIDLLKGGHYFPDAGMRISGTFTHPNILSFYLILALTSFIIYLEANKTKINKIFKYFLFILIVNVVLLIIFTKTRNAWFALILLSLFYGFVKDRKFLLILLLLLPLLFSIPAVQSRLISLKDKSDYQGMNSWEWRINMWKSSLEPIKERPFTGYGLATFQSMSEDFSNVGKNGAHNTYLQTLFESGLFGLLAFLYLLLTPIYHLLNKIKESKLWTITIGYLLSYLIICFADNLSYYLVLNWYVWWFIGLILLSRKFINSND